HAKTPCKHRMFDPPWSSHFFPEDPRTTHLNPAQAVDKDLGFHGGFGIGEVARPEPYSLESHAPIELLQKTKKMAECNVFVHDDPFQLLKLRQVSGINGFSPVNPPDAEDLDGGLRVRHQVLNGQACGVGAQ